MTRDDSKMFEYNPTYDDTNNIYLNAFYTSLDTDNIILTRNDCIQLTGDDIDDYCTFDDLEKTGIYVSNEGKQISYNNIEYYLVDKNDL